MTLVDFLLILLVAGICGAVGHSMVSYNSAGCLGSVVLGFIGALLGTWLARVSGLPEFLPLTVGGRSFPIVWTILGAALFVAVLNILAGRRAAE